jgi:hypothetical protein
LVYTADDTIWIAGDSALNEDMKRLLLLFLFTAALSLRAAEPASDPVMGVYEGFWKASDGTKGRISAQIRPLGGGQYDGFVAFYKAKTLEGVLKLKPGSGKFDSETVKSSEGPLTPAVSGSGQIEKGKLSGSFKGELGEGVFEGTLAHPKAPRLGTKPPKRAKVLFDGKPAPDAWKDFHWKVTPEGTMIVQGGDIHAKDAYANYLLHVEFRTPLMPEAQGQARGNSGVYLQSKYEVQVLDSFGLFPLQNNDCAAIYSLKAPEVNACLPPGEWQSYDITFVQGNPARKAMPTITVVHNGVKVIDHFELPQSVIEKGTTAADGETGFLKLQDHGNPIEYRNVWVEPFFATERK